MALVPAARDHAGKHMTRACIGDKAAIFCNADAAVRDWPPRNLHTSARTMAPLFVAAAAARSNPRSLMLDKSVKILLMRGARLRLSRPDPALRKKSERQPGL